MIGASSKPLPRLLALLSRLIPRRCLGCRRIGWSVVRRRQRTSYVDDRLNFATLCPACQAAADEEWAERWAEYYGSRL